MAKMVDCIILLVLLGINGVVLQQQNGDDCSSSQTSAAPYEGRWFTGKALKNVVPMTSKHVPTVYGCNQYCNYVNGCIAVNFDDSLPSGENNCSLFNATNIAGHMTDAPGSIVILKLPFECNQTSTVNGTWSAWQSTSNCSVTCGNGTETRERFCNNPEPSCNGDECDGASTEEIACAMDPCSVDGGWSDWGARGNCSVSCGNGTRRSTRSCTNPSPFNGGVDCLGDAVLVEGCNLGNCSYLITEFPKNRAGAITDCGAQGLYEYDPSDNPDFSDLLHSMKYWVTCKASLDPPGCGCSNTNKPVIDMALPLPHLGCKGKSVPSQALCAA